MQGGEVYTGRDQGGNERGKLPALKVAIIGTGYVGLTTGVCLAYLGHRVTCVDIDPAKPELLQCGKARSTSQACRCPCTMFKSQSPGSRVQVLGGER